MENIESSKLGEYILTAKWNDDGYYDTHMAVDRQLANKIQMNFIKTYAKHTRRRGFRPGKIPKQIIEQELGGIEATYSASFCTLANAKIMEAAPRKVMLTNDHRVTCGSNGWWNVWYKVWLEPQVDIPYDMLDMNFEIERIDVENYVLYRLHNFADMNPYLHPKTTDEGEYLPAEEGDMVEVSVDAYIDDESFIDGCERATNIRLNNSVKPATLLDRLIGSMPGSTFTLETENIDELPGVFQDSMRDKKKFSMTVTVNHIHTCSESNIDDDLAISAGFENLEEWKTSLRDTGNRIVETREKQIKRSMVLEHILSKCSIPDPPSEWIKAKRNELMQMDNVKDNIDQYLEEFDNLYKQTVILKELGKQLNIDWDEEELNKPMYARNEAQYSNKVLEELVSRAGFIYVEPETKEVTEED